MSLVLHHHPQSRAAAVVWMLEEVELGYVDLMAGELPGAQPDGQADVVLGATLRWMLQFEMIDPRPSFLGYAGRLAARPAFVTGRARNLAALDEHPPRV